MDKKDFADVVRMLVGLINDIVPVLLGIALLFFFWSGIRYIYKAGDAKGKNEERQALLWGLAALFILFSIWGILGLLGEAFSDRSDSVETGSVPDDPWEGLR